MSDGPIQNEYSIYTEEQINVLIEDGIIHETIREIISSGNTHALCDLIIYTDTYDPDILDDAIRELPYEDKLWFISNREVIITMYPDTYTNMLSNWRVSLRDTLCPQRLLMAFTELLNPDAPNYELVTEVWLHVANFEEIIDILSELNPKNVLAANADGQLFEFMALILDTKSERIANLPDGQLTNIVYTPILQSYLDVLGNYIRPYPYRTNPKIVTAYNAMRKYLEEQECEISVYIMLVNQFHEEDIQIFKDICDVLTRFPADITLTTDFGYGVLLECVRFDLPDMLETMLRKYNITPNTLHEDPYNYKLIAKLLFAAVSPVHRNGCLEFFQESGYITGYQSWFRDARYEELEIISGCDWPLVAFVGDTAGIRLRDYQGTGLILQFLRMNDLTNTGEIQTELTDHIMSVWREHKIQPISGPFSGPLSESADELTNELTKYLRGRRYDHAPNLVRNKLYQLGALAKGGFISQDTYDVLAQEVFILYLLHAISDKYATMEIAKLFTEYQPIYTPHYWMALLLSGLTPTAHGFTEAVQVLLGQYPDFAAKNNHNPTDFVDMILPVKEYNPQCPPTSIIAKTATVIKLLYPTGDSDGKVNSPKILEKLSNIKFSGGIAINLLLIISVYSRSTGFEFQLSELLIGKLREEIPSIAKFEVNKLVLNSVFTNYCYVLARHTDLTTGQQIMQEFLNELFMNNTSCSCGVIHVPFTSVDATPEIIAYMHAALNGSCFVLEETLSITDADADADAKVKWVIKPTREYAKKIQNSRRRNWCANHQISCGTLELSNIYDPPSGSEFICPITFEPQHVGDYVIRLLGCRHTFSADSIIKWCEAQNSSSCSSSCTCPFCRSDLVDGKLSGANCEMFELV